MASAPWIIGSIAGALVVFGSGLMLTRAGRPYGAVMLNVHKLVDLALVVIVGLAVYQSFRAESFAAVEWAFVGTAVALVVLLFASGGVVSASEAPPDWLRLAHKIVPWFALAAVAASLYLVLR